uniref:Uncharacterized protein LOC104227925 n=1 Tax=Nicotiana sylvestris TaxID=4096 RepID=A0A1U7WWJ4_NICSY|nr:PREDICTED: uncharacterized protein LOC104227925 [Nicotiana sylvestris]
MLSCEVTRKDVDKAVKELQNDKAPGIDGFLGEFFKEYWSTIGDEVGTAVLKFFSNRKMLKSVNCTTLTLIPKRVNRQTPREERLRQGDPVSPYLFVLVMEYLNRALKKLKDNPDFNHHPRCARNNITHICFADDLIRCSKADEVSIKLLLKSSNHFSEVSWLKANLEKSALYIAGVTREFKEMILEEMQFTLGELLFRYLGVPLSSKKLSVQQCMPLIEKITARINCWTTKLLSYSGRLQLLKSVIFEMQTYWAQVFLLPKKILKMIVAVCRTFLWTGKSDLSRRALVAWDTICMPLLVGG